MVDAGFGKDFDVNTGPWELCLLDRSTGRASIERYSTLPEWERSALARVPPC